MRATAAALLLAGAPWQGTAATDPADPPPPDAADVVAAYQHLRPWVHAFRPPPLQDAAARTPLGGADAACVILRRDGRVLGLGTDTSGNDLMLRRAAGRALGHVLGQPALASLARRLNDEDNPSDLTLEQVRADLGRSLTIELEIAGRFLPMPGRSWAQIADQLQPGLDGVAMRRGPDWAVLFPAQLRHTNRAGEPARLLPSLAADLGMTAAPLDVLARQHDVSIYRFRTIHLVQAAPDRRPVETFRGDEIVPLETIDLARIARLADDLASRLVDTRWPDDPPPWVEGTYDKPPGVRGDYQAIADTYEPASAPPLAQALVAIALRRYARAPGVNADVALQAESAAARILDDLAGWDDARRAAQDNPQAAAAIVYAILERPADLPPAVRTLLDGAMKSVLDAGALTNDESSLAPHGRALVAGAIARLAATNLGAVEPIDAADVRRAIDLAWRSAPMSRHVSLLPWIAWAEADLARATGDIPSNSGALLRIRAMLATSQIGTDQRPGPLDLHGGFVLSAARTPRADAQSTRPAVGLAWMLAQPGLTSDEDRPAARAQLRQAMRFLVQLSAREPWLWSLPSPRRARGGLRNAPWDADQPVPAQAMGLLAAAEALQALSQPAQP